MAEDNIYQKNGSLLEFRKSARKVSPAFSANEQTQDDDMTKNSYYLMAADGDPEVMNDLGVDYAINKEGFHGISPCGKTQGHSQLTELP